MISIMNIYKNINLIYKQINKKRKIFQNKDNFIINIKDILIIYKKINQDKKNRKNYNKIMNYNKID